MSSGQHHETGVGTRRLLVVGAALMSVGGFLAGCSSSHNSVGTATTSSSSPSGSSLPSGTGAAGSLGAITSKLQGSATTSYDVTYTASGSNSQTRSLEFAESPPNNFAVVVTNANGTQTKVVSTRQLSDTCTQSGAKWSCVQLPRAQFSTFLNAFQIYKSSYWGKILAGMQAAARSGGITVKPSTKSLAGQHVQCVTYSGGAAGSGGEICVTSDGVLAYVHSSVNNSTFELSSYSTSPAPSLFSLPPGATVTSAS